MAFDFELAKAILDNVRRYDGRGMGGDMKRSFELFPAGSYATFITNHDQERVMSTFLGSTEKAATAGSILLTGPGVPFIYYGEEIGMRDIRVTRSEIQDPLGRHYWPIPVGLKYPLMILAVFVIFALLYEFLIRRIAALRLVFGREPAPARRREATP